MGSKAWRNTRIVLGVVWGVFCAGFSAFAIFESTRNGDDSANVSNIFDKKIHGEDIGPVKAESFSVSLTRYSAGKKVGGIEDVYHRGDYLTYAYSFSPEDSKGEVKAVSSNAAAFRIDGAFSRVVAVGEGEAKITFTCADVEGVKYEYTLRCERVPVTGISLPVASVALSIGDTYDLKASALPSNAENPELGYESLNPAIASVSSSGIVKAIGGGRTSIRVYSKDNPAVEKTVHVRVGALSKMRIEEEELGAYPNQIVYFHLKYETTGDPFEPWRAKFVSSPIDEAISVALHSHDAALGEAVYRLSYGDIHLNEPKTFDINFTYDSGYGEFVDALCFSVSPLKTFDFVPKPQTVARTIAYNSAYGEGKPVKANLSVSLTYDGYSKDLAYQYVLPTPKAIASPGLTVPRCSLTGVNLQTQELLDPAKEYYFDFYPDQNNPDQSQRYVVTGSYSDYACLLQDFTMGRLKTVEDDGEDAVNVFLVGKTYETTPASASFQPSSPFASSGVSAYVEGDASLSPIVNVSGKVNLKALQGNEAGETSLILRSAYEDNRGKVNVEKHAKIRFIAQEPTAFSVNSSLFEGEVSEDKEVALRPFEPFSLRYASYCEDPYDGKRIYFPEADFEVSDETVLRYDDSRDLFMPIQTGEVTVRFSSNGAAPFTLRLRVEGEKVSLEDARLSYQDVSVYKDNAMASDGSYCAVDTSFSAVTTLPSSLQGQELIYASSDPHVLFVNELGQCKAVGRGEAFLYAALKENPSVSNRAFVKVYDSVGNVSVNLDTYRGLAQTIYTDESRGIRALAGTTAVYYSERIRLNIEETCSARDVSYSYLINDKGISSSEVASVSADGSVTFKKEGNAVIEVTVGEEGSPYRKSVVVVYRVRTTLGTSDSPITRKQWGHLLLFFCTVGCGLLCFFCLPIHNYIRWGSEIFMPLYGFGLAYLTEFIQGQVPGRAFTWSDIWLDTRGGLYAAAVGVVIYGTIEIVKFIRRRKAKKQEEQTK